MSRLHYIRLSQKCLHWIMIKWCALCWCENCPLAHYIYAFGKKKCNFLILSIVWLCIYTRIVTINSFMRTVAKADFCRWKFYSFCNKNNVIPQVSLLPYLLIYLVLNQLSKNCNFLQFNYWKFCYFWVYSTYLKYKC